MKRASILFSSSFALLLAGQLFGQNPPDFPATPNPGTAAASPRPVASPGMQRTPSAPEEGVGKSSTPAAPRTGTQEDRSRVTPSMPTGYPGMKAAGPADPADCSNDGWTGYAKPKFKSQKNCEDWARTHSTTAAQPGATPRSRMTTPSARTTPPSPQPR